MISAHFGSLMDLPGRGFRGYQKNHPVGDESYPKLTFRVCARHLSLLDAFAIGRRTIQAARVRASEPH
jgi:hypothetical protein